MLASHNILNPCQWFAYYGAFTRYGTRFVLYYQRTSFYPRTPYQRRRTYFHSPEEVNIAYNEQKLDLNAL